MRLRTVLGVIALAMLVSVPASAQLAPYSQDFEPPFDPSPSFPDPGSIAADGWFFFVNVFAAGTGDYLGGYGGAPPQGGPNFCGIALDQGGPDQGLQVMSVYSDYNNDGDHGAGNLLETNLYQQQAIGDDDLGKTCTFSWQHKLDNLADPTTAAAFIKVFLPDFSGTVAFPQFDTSNLSTDWAGGSLEVVIDPDWNGYPLQFGFVNNATNFDPSSNFYDNIDFSCEDPQAVPATSNTTLFIFFVLLAATMTLVIATLAKRTRTDLA